MRTESPEDPSRRKFLSAATCALGACAGAAAFGPAIVAVISPIEGGVVKLGEGLVDVGPLDAFEPGVPRKVVVRAARTDAYLREPPRALGSVLVVRQGDRVVTFSSTCPHAGCDVSPGKDGLLCPCHDSVFALSGELVSGPSPRALDALATEVRDGRVLVKFERFQIGTADKRAL